MKFLSIQAFILCLAIFGVFSNGALAAKKGELIEKVIYGHDERLDLFESSDRFMKELARSSAVQIYNNALIEGEDGLFRVKAQTLTEIGMCKSERFSNQPTAGDCSAFLVAPDKIVTAGHCIASDNECAGHSWVFDYSNTDGVKKDFVFDRSQVYRCTKILERKKDEVTQSDYAVLKLDRPVVGRTPLEVRQVGKVSNDAILTVIGNPSGLPTKITSGAEIRENTNRVYFVTNADTYHGNSGSAVVDTRTGVVEGILVRGDTDYTKSAAGCYVSVVRKRNEGRGEDVTRITIINSLKRRN